MIADSQIYTRKYNESLPGLKEELDSLHGEISAEQKEFKKLYDQRGLLLKGIQEAKIAGGGDPSIVAKLKAQSANLTTTITDILSYIKYASPKHLKDHSSRHEINSAKNALNSAACANIITAVELLIKDAKEWEHAIVQFFERYACDMLYYGAIAVGMAFDAALVALVPEIEALQADPMCTYFGPSQKIPATNLIFNDLLTYTVTALCSLDDILLGPAAQYISTKVCGVAYPPVTIVNLVQHMMCGQLESAVVDVLILPILCNVKIGDRICKEDLGAYCTFPI
eukprot:Awhi_evm3s13264